jgi:indolepyruvate ferredoxin oxidoreductase alpha subunit
MLGNEAIAAGAYDAGVGFVSSYPGTPSTEITEYIAEYDVYAEWAPNEKVAVECALGASVAGVRALAAMKHVGLNVAADPLFTASYTGVNGGLVICVADDPGMHSSQNEQDSRHYARASKIIMLEPSDSAECYAFTKAAFDISERFDTPVIIRLTTRVAHSRSSVETTGKSSVSRREYTKNIGKYVMMPAMARGRHKFIEQRGESIVSFSETSDLNNIEYNDKKIGVITSGICYQYAREALGDTASYLKLGIVWPLADKLINEFIDNVEQCWVLEELDPFIEQYVRAGRISDIRGKNMFTMLGEYSARMIKSVVLGAENKFLALDNLPVRPPALCNGCPHTKVFEALKSIDGLIITGDIGCYTLGALPPLSMLDTCVCMGASVSMAHGMLKAQTGESKIVSVLGDSTFIHSGITGLINMVYNKSPGTVLILDNSTTGMTGHQDNPATGLTLKGEPTWPLNLEKLCEAVGVRRVVTVDPYNAEEIRAAILNETAANEPSVVICRRPCVLLKAKQNRSKSHQA